MCIICIDYAKGKMTAKEARRALGEMTEKIGDEHMLEVEYAIRPGLWDEALRDALLNNT